jgi:hypothetical protein
MQRPCVVGVLYELLVGRSALSCSLFTLFLKVNLARLVLLCSQGECEEGRHGLITDVFLSGNLLCCLASLNFCALGWIFSL